MASGTLLAAFAGPDRASARASAKKLRGCPGANVQPSPETLGQTRRAMLCLINAERAARGLRPLTPDTRLQAAADGHSQDMGARDFFDHVTPDGTGAAERLRAAGVSATSLAENLAWGSGVLARPAAILKSWMSSAPHRATILDPALGKIGIGIALDAPEPDVADGAAYTADFTGASSRRTARTARRASRRAR